MELLLTQSTDAELVQIARNGDTAAFGELVRRYQGLVYGLACHHTGDFTDAQDVAQEVFVKAFRSIDQLKQPDRFASWLKAITINQCKMMIRGSRRTIALDEAEQSPSYASMIEQDWKRQQRRVEIRQAVDCLPEKSRLITTMHYLSGLSHGEIGEFLEMPANAVAQHLHRARRQLKQILLAEIEEDYTMNRLPDTFAQDILARLTLYPIREGYIMTADGEGDAKGLIMAVGEGPEKAYITIWMKKDDLNDVTLGTLPARTSETPKGRALDSTLQILDALSTEIRQVVLRLSNNRRCRATVELVQGDTVTAIDMRPSDAMALAFRVKAPIYAEDAVIQRGNVGEDDVPVPDENMDPALHNAEYERIRKTDIITDKAFEMISLDNYIDTIRFHKDEQEGVLRVYPEADPEQQATFDLQEYEPGVDLIFDMAHRRASSGRLKGDPVSGWTERYKFLFSMLGNDARMRVVAEGEGE